MHGRSSDALRLAAQEYTETEAPDVVTSRLQDPPAIGALMQRPTEDSVALAFAERHKGQYVYLHGRGKWAKWDGTRWREDMLDSVRHDMRNLARAYNIEGKAQTARLNFINGIEGFCRSDPAFAREVTDFDQDNYLLNTPAGTFDLRSMVCHPHNPDDNITLITSVAPVEGRGAVFSQFLSEITQGDVELQGFLQRALGACLSGAVEEHWFMFFTGLGRNGKNTLGDAVKRVLNDYSRSIPSATLMNQKHQQHATEIMNLKGMRLVVSGEIEEGSHWAEAKLKELTGDDTLNGHYMHRDWMTFKRTHKHLIFGNYRPQLRNVDAGIRSRMKIVPFRASFLGREDADLPRKLDDEAGYILAWLMEGHRDWMDAGKRIGSCAAVDEETRDYYDSQSTIEMWISERCRVVNPQDCSAKHWSKAGDLYSDYRQWKLDRGEYPVTHTRFGEQLASRYRKVNSNGKRYEGLLLQNANFH
ncbi:hypothetical protein CWI75_08745 [Kineobactrum sediminis]|uniref:SF3 helicase domain-containing protein n=1 Tax=Kineobactrum sediminis TaxID=1905677 RepID=A0A2N5Y2P7_9GAMM|nr:phage/plasmid primase, P4 family [Kineobactrum sediminis]PLW82662.1 hypothetical protein CWI75_08745 [Kineobactrum sediminis]